MIVFDDLQLSHEYAEMGNMPISHVGKLMLQGFRMDLVPDTI